MSQKNACDRVIIPYSTIGPSATTVLVSKGGWQLILEDKEQSFARMVDETRDGYMYVLQADIILHCELRTWFNLLSYIITKPPGIHTDNSAVKIRLQYTRVQPTSI